MVAASDEPGRAVNDFLNFDAPQDDPKNGKAGTVASLPGSPGGVKCIGLGWADGRLMVAKSSGGTGKAESRPPSKTRAKATPVFVTPPIIDPAGNESTLGQLPSIQLDSAASTTK
jgi:hypothetical protein